MSSHHYHSLIYRPNNRIQIRSQKALKAKLKTNLWRIQPLEDAVAAAAAVVVVAVEEAGAEDEVEEDAQEDLSTGPRLLRAQELLVILLPESALPKKTMTTRPIKTRLIMALSLIRLSTRMSPWERPGIQTTRMTMQ